MTKKLITAALCVSVTAASGCAFTGGAGADKTDADDGRLSAAGTWRVVKMTNINDGEIYDNAEYIDIEFEFNEDGSLYLYQSGEKSADDMTWELTGSKIAVINTFSDITEGIFGDNMMEFGDFGKTGFDLVLERE